MILTGAVDWRPRVAAEVTDLLESHRQQFELTSAEAYNAASEVVAKDPVARVAWADDKVVSLASSYFRRLEESLKIQVGIHELIPLEASCLAPNTRVLLLTRNASPRTYWLMLFAIVTTGGWPSDASVGCLARCQDRF